MRFDYGPLDIANYVQQQGEMGRQRGKESRLARLYAQGIESPDQRQPLLADIARTVSPQDAQAAEKGWQGSEEVRYQQLGRMASLLTSAPAGMRPQLYKSMVPELTRLGLQAPPDYTPEIDPLAERLAQVYGGFKAGESELPSSVREAMAFRADPSLLETRRQIYGSYSYGTVELPDGTTAETRRNSRTGEMEMVLPGGRVIPLAGATGVPGAPQGSPAPQSAPPPAPVGSGVPQSAQFDDPALNSLPEDARLQAGRLAAMGVPFYIDGGRVIVGESGGLRRPPAPMPTAAPAPPPLLQRPGAMGAPASQAGGFPTGGGFGRPAEAEAAAVEEAKLRQQLALAGDIKAREAEGKGLAEQGLKRLEDIRGKASLAASQNASYMELERLLDQAYTGPGANAALTLGRLGAIIGIGDTQRVSAAEAARALSNRLALSLRNPAGGEGMPGAMSDADREFLQSSIPSLQNSPEGWRQMIAYQRKLNDAAIAQAAEAERFIASGGRPSDLPRHMQEYAERNRIFAQSSGARPSVGMTGFSAEVIE